MIVAAISAVVLTVCAVVAVLSAASLFGNREGE